MKFFLRILLCVMFAYALAAYLAIPANPEIKFWHGVDQIRDQEIATIRLLHPQQPLVLFTGGSSCAFSIDPKIIEEKCGLPAFNLGLPVSAGPKYLLHQALEKSQKGDILVVCLEPDALTYTDHFAASQLGFALASSNKEPSSAGGGSSFRHSLSIREYLNLSRPGPGYLAVWFAKVLTGKSYRYQNEDIRYHGRIETSITVADLPRAGFKQVDQLCATGRVLLLEFRNAASSKGVRLVYSMPWVLTAEDAADHNRLANQKIQESIRNLIPVIDDGHQGVVTDPTFFSDSALHLSSVGSAQRSAALGDGLNHWLNPSAPY